MVEGNVSTSTAQPAPPVITPLIPKVELDAKAGEKKEEKKDEKKPPEKNESKPAIQPPPTKNEAKDFAADFLVGELIKAASIGMRSMNSPWSKMAQFQQEQALLGVKQRVEAAVKEAVDVIASTARLTFRAQVESVTFKDGVKASLKMAKTEDAHVLADQSGKAVLIVIEDYARFLNAGDAAKGDPDQPPLFEQSQAAKDPKDAATPPRRPPKKKAGGKPKAKTASRKGRGK